MSRAPTRLGRVQAEAAAAARDPRGPGAAPSAGFKRTCPGRVESGIRVEGTRSPRRCGHSSLAEFKFNVTRSPAGPGGGKSGGSAARFKLEAALVLRNG